MNKWYEKVMAWGTTTPLGNQNIQEPRPNNPELENFEPKTRCMNFEKSVKFVA